MTVGRGRWHQAQRSPYQWEQEGLDFVRAQMQDNEPYRAWALFKMTAKTGHVREMDLFVVTPGGLSLVELKGHPGHLTNKGKSWRFKHSSGVYSLKNPLDLTDQKSKELRERLTWASTKLQTGLAVPRIEPAVFLHGEDLLSELDEQQRILVYGRDDRMAETKLGGIWAWLDRVPHDDKQRAKAAAFSKVLPELMKAIGIDQVHRVFRVGHFDLDREPLESGPDWQDLLGKNPNLRGDVRRVRVYLSRLQATGDERLATARAAKREYEVLAGLHHRGIAQALDYQTSERGPAVIFAHDEVDTKLGDYLAINHGTLTLGARLDLVRQLGEAMAYAHRHHVYHRALAARSVYVHEGQPGRPLVRIIDWQAAVRTGDPVRPSTHPGLESVPLERSASIYLAPEWRNPEADPVRLDVFGLGGLAYLILTGRPPAPDRPALAAAIRERGGLQVASALDAAPESLDALVYQATCGKADERTPDVSAFLAGLDEVERELATPEQPDEPDPLEAKPGQPLDGSWQVVKVLGSGATARALLAEDANADPKASQSKRFRVYKVALEGQEARLIAEAEALRSLHSAKIVKLLEEPLTIGGRAVIVLEQAGGGSLAGRLAAHGRCTPDELQRFGRDLFDALDHLAGKTMWHRDIKPANLGVRVRRNGSKELVLFDFSLASARDIDLQAGTRDYLDPFLGPPRRATYDEHAEWYAATVTLHEMASGVLPSWGEDGVEPEFVNDETPQIASDGFEASYRDGLTQFFHRALQRDSAKRFTTLEEMRFAWEDVFRQANAALPATTSAEALAAADERVGLSEEDVRAARDVAAQAASATSTLADAGLSPRALEAASRLGAQTVADLAGTSTRAVWGLRGIGGAVRSELLQRIRQWKPLLASPRTPAKKTESGGALFNIDDVAATLLPRTSRRSKTREAIRLLLGLPGEDGLTALSPWPRQVEVVPVADVQPATISNALTKSVDQWTDSLQITALREEVVDGLRRLGRVAEVHHLAEDLLDRHGSEEDDPRLRIALALAVLRAAVETEQRADAPRLLVVRHLGQVLVALESTDSAHPAPQELVDYATKLGRRADQLAESDPLPSPATVVRELRAVSPPDGMPPINNARLVGLAASVTERTAVTARSELYPRDLPLARALRLSQAPVNLGADGLTLGQLLARVHARFPGLEIGEPSLQQVRKALKAADSDLDYRDGVFRRPTVVSTGWPSTRTGTIPASRIVADEPVAAMRRRLTGSQRRGGFLALNVRLGDAELAASVLSRQDGVTPVDVTTRFVRLLKDGTAAKGVDWAKILQADAQSTERRAWHPDLRSFIDEVWPVLREELTAVDRTLLLYAAGPLARYPGGEELLADVQHEARASGRSPTALWLLCPVEAPSERPRLDKIEVEVISDNEWCEFPTEVLRAL